MHGDDDRTINLAAALLLGWWVAVCVACGGLAFALGWLARR